MIVIQTKNLDLGRRIDLHMHTLLSDGVLLPSELIQRASRQGYEAIAITDHTDASNLDFVIRRIANTFKAIQNYVDMRLVLGVELTHIPPVQIDAMARKAKRKGATLVVVHGETPIETVREGTNRAALESDFVDILAHPGLIKEDDVKLAKDNGIYLEISTRRGHCLANGRVARLASNAKAKLVVNTDLHSPEEMITQDAAYKVALASGLSEREAIEAIRENPKRILLSLQL